MVGRIRKLNLYKKKEKKDDGKYLGRKEEDGSEHCVAGETKVMRYEDTEPKVENNTKSN